ncbi:MAG: rhomboid family intramembrane serine protease [Mesorhizobium amorphae]|nr:MAG: rhomboid family intramembrane serine protease [Mesorhizobium amorphae]
MPAVGGHGPARTPRSEPAFNLPPVVLAAIALCVGVHLVRTQILNADQDLALLLRTAFVPVFLSGPYDWDIWTLASTVTYSLLHGGILHLGVNMVWLAAFGSPLASRMGAWRFVLFWIAASVAGALVFFAFNPTLQAPLVGASGAIAGMMGAAARFAFRIDRSGRGSRFAGQPLSIAAALSSRNVLVFVGIWLAVNLATGLLGAAPGEPSIAWEAHLGGFLLGFLFVGPFLPRRMA